MNWEKPKDEQLEKEIDELTSVLQVELFTEEQEPSDFPVLDIDYQKIEKSGGGFERVCGVCGGKDGLEIKEYRAEEGHMEEYHKWCHDCGLYVQWCYGYGTTSIDDMEWFDSYHDKPEDEYVIKRDMEMKIVAMIISRILKGKSVSENEMAYLPLLQKRSMAFYEGEDVLLDAEAGFEQI